MHTYTHMEKKRTSYENTRSTRKNRDSIAMDDPSWKENEPFRFSVIRFMQSHHEHIRPAYIVSVVCEAMEKHTFG